MVTEAVKSEREKKKARKSESNELKTTSLWMRLLAMIYTNTTYLSVVIRISICLGGIQIGSGRISHTQRHLTNGKAMDWVTIG